MKAWNAWWDFDHGAQGMTCIVQTSHPNDKSHYIAKFSGNQEGIDLAENLISRIEQGHVDVLKMIKKANKENG